MAVPELSAESVASVIRDLRDSRHAAAMPGRPGRCAALASAARRFLDPGDPLREQARKLLPAATGFSSETIDESLARIFGVLAAGSIERATDVRGEVLPVVAVVSAGNIPGVAIPKAVLALAAGAACLVKCGSGEPVLAPLFAQALDAASAPLGRALAVVWWRGGAEPWERLLGSWVDSLVAYGSDGAIESLRQTAPAAFVGHGHRLSAALVRGGPRTPLAPAAAAAALDVAMYDQLGCLSPHCVYVVGSPDRGRRFAEAMAAALGRLAAALPRGEIPIEASIAVRALRDETEWRSLANEAVRAYASPAGIDWTVIHDENPAFRPSPLYRTVFVRPLDRPSALATALGVFRPLVECIGAAPLPDAEIETAVAECGIPNLVALGEMQRPGLAWRQGGRDPLSGIIRERTANR